MSDSTRRRPASVIEQQSESGRKTALREGFTSGSAVSAAAAAAVTLLLRGRTINPVRLRLPPFKEQAGPPLPLGKAGLEIPIAYVQKLRQGVKAAVIKDGGDDPDATHGLLLEVYAAFEESAFEHEPGVWLELSAHLRLKAGTGVGLATLPGLPVRPGEPAINPQPRKQIEFAVGRVLDDAAADLPPGGKIYLCLRIPRGEEKAELTLNSRLGVRGGISILGTRGTVRPYSNAAWRATISQGLDIAQALGTRCVAFSTGRRSEQGLRELYPRLPEQAFIQAADFAAFAIRSCLRRHFEEIIWGCYSGKLLKLAQGLEYTHARSSPADLPLLASWARECGADAAESESILEFPTVQGAFDLLEKNNPPAARLLLERVAAEATRTLTAWLDNGAGRPPRLTLRVFRPDNTLWLTRDWHDAKNSSD